METKGYFSPTVKVRKKLNKASNIRRIAKAMHIACSAKGKYCMYRNMCSYGWLCDEIHKENLSLAHMDKIQITPVLTSLVVKASLRLSSDEGAAELWDLFIQHINNPRQKKTKYASLAAAAHLNSGLSEEEGVKRIKIYMETLV